VGYCPDFNGQIRKVPAHVSSCLTLRSSVFSSDKFPERKHKHMDTILALAAAALDWIGGAGLGV
jgi:hypothetical protein